MWSESEVNLQWYDCPAGTRSDAADSPPDAELEGVA
jgi:hypothetical protein